MNYTVLAAAIGPGRPVCQLSVVFSERETKKTAEKTRQAGVARREGPSARRESTARRGTALVGEQTQTQITIVDANTPWVQQLDILMMPHTFLRAATANRATVKLQTVGGTRYTVVTFVGQNKALINGYINDQNLVEKVETRIDNPMLGDMLIEALYSDYKDFDGVKFPTKIVQKQGGFSTLDLAVSEVKPNAPVDIQPVQGRGAAPAAAVAAGGQAPARSESVSRVACDLSLW